VGDDSVGQLSHLRSQAKKLGLAIRVQRTSRGSASRLYSVIDRETGQVTYADVQLADVQTRLMWIVRDRRLGLERPGPGDGPPEERCPSCGTRRVSFFRFCTACGLDYEATLKPTPAFLLEPRQHEPTGGRDTTLEPVVPPIQRPAPPGESVTARVAGWASDVANGYRFGWLRVLLGGAILGLLIGTIVALALGART
jgi:hypothetical protein